MFVEKQLVNNLTRINLDIEKIKNLEDLSKVYGMDKETIKYALDRNGCATWIIIEKMAQ